LRARTKRRVGRNEPDRPSSSSNETDVFRQPWHYDGPEKTHHDRDSSHSSDERISKGSLGFEVPGTKKKEGTTRQVTTKWHGRRGKRTNESMIPSAGRENRSPRVYEVERDMITHRKKESSGRLRRSKAR